MTPPPTPSSPPSFEEVRAFLQQLHAKMRQYSLVFLDNRDKNQQALVALKELGVKAVDRRGYIERLTPYDFCQGPTPDEDTLPPGNGDLWVFGQRIGGTDFYIKVQLGRLGKSTICISFHPAERRLKRLFTV